MEDNTIEPSLLTILACPRDGGPLSVVGSRVTCVGGHHYPIISGVPVMLLDDMRDTLWVASASRKVAQLACLKCNPEPYEDSYFLDTLGIDPEHRAPVRREIEEGRFGEVDPVVRYSVADSCGRLYKRLVGHLSTYPIPDIRLSRGRGEFLLDIGCNWGRWSVAASRKGYRPVGVDPSLGAVLAARRVSKQLNAPCMFVVADARNLPFHPSSFDVVFSYSVLQHFSKQDARTALSEAARVVKDEGTCLIQMANAIGLRSLQLQMRRGFREAKGFEVRYWTLPELLSTFSKLIGPSSAFVDGYFGLGIQPSDAGMLTPAGRVVVYASELLRRLSNNLPLMRYFADSLYIRAVRQRTRREEYPSLAPSAVVNG